jgi:predicted RNase H-like HicB family nuclease
MTSGPRVRKNSDAPTGAPHDSADLSRMPKWGYPEPMKLTLTAVFRRFPEGYAAFVEELPGANTQGATLEEARANLAEAVNMVLQANRELAEEDLRGQGVIREPLLLGTA